MTVVWMCFVVGICAVAVLAVLLVAGAEERDELADVPDFDEHTEQALAIARLGDDFTEWEKELTRR